MDLNGSMAERTDGRIILDGWMDGLMKSKIADRRSDGHAGQLGKREILVDRSSPSLLEVSPQRFTHTFDCVPPSVRPNGLASEIVSG